jgi:hypothetical protein
MTVCMSGKHEKVNECGVNVSVIEVNQHKKDFFKYCKLCLGQACQKWVNNPFFLVHGPLKNYPFRPQTWENNVLTFSGVKVHSRVC